METAKPVQVVQHHPRSPDASLERLRELAGIITLEGPAPSTKFLEGEGDDQPSERARD